MCTYMCDIPGSITNRGENSQIITKELGTSNFISSQVISHVRSHITFALFIYQNATVMSPLQRSVADFA